MYVAWPFKSGALFVADGAAPSATPTAPSLVTQALPNAQVGVAYSAQLVALGTAPLTWHVSGLPSGWAVDSTGHITGPAPSAVGSLTLNVYVTNAYGASPASGSVAFTIAIAPAPPAPPAIASVGFRQIPDLKTSGAWSTSAT
jgi:hypothetical protein